MRFKIISAKEFPHQGPVTCIGWSGTEEVYSLGDDHKLLSWNVSNNEFTEIATLSTDLLPIDMQFLPRIGGTVTKHSDLLLITSANGKFYIMNRSGRIERAIDAHKGAVLIGQWSYDGSSLLTAGEDGFIKIWSRSGMLRSTVISGEQSIYAANWAPDSQGIVYSQGKCLNIKKLLPNTKQLKWKAHEGLVLKVSWSPASELIISGGEDCRYRVWDSQGRSLYTSGPHDYPITSLSWAPSGDLFVVGAYNTLRLCDQSGWSECLEKPNSGCIYNLAWSNDGTQIAGACANGSVIFAHILNRTVHYLHLTAEVIERKTIKVHDVNNDSNEQLDLPERVIQMSLKFEHLVVTTPQQCHIYNIKNWNTPTIFDLKEGAVILLILCEKHMLIVERSTVSLYNYQGRLIGTPRWPNMRLESLRQPHISLSNDTLVVRDYSDHKVAHVLELSSNRLLTESSTIVAHSQPILQIALDQAGLPLHRIMAVLDRNRDLYITAIRGPHKSFCKLGVLAFKRYARKQCRSKKLQSTTACKSTQIQSFTWNSEQNMIAAIQDTHLVVWFCPTACFSTTLLRLCSFIYDSPELGRRPILIDFNGDSVSIRRVDGSLVTISVSPFPSLLHRSIEENKWDNALRLCRFVDDHTLWACLAVLATQSKSDVLDIAEEAYSAINLHDKVLYIQYIKNLPQKAQQLADTALLGGSLSNAESLLLHNGLVYFAILMNIQVHNWNRALDLAVKHKAHIDTVLYLRNNYLVSLDKEENNKKFMGLKDNIIIDEDKIKEKMFLEASKNNI